MNKKNFLSFCLKGYVCSCSSGLKVAGCCTHVATVIFYFSYARFYSFRLPGEHLNSIFINKQEKQAPNKPKYIRHKRSADKKIETEHEIEINSSSSDSDNDLVN